VTVSRNQNQKAEDCRTRPYLEYIQQLKDRNKKQQYCIPILKHSVIVIYNRS
jgi:hypothetical protein